MQESRARSRDDIVRGGGRAKESRQYTVGMKPVTPGGVAPEMARRSRSTADALAAVQRTPSVKNTFQLPSLERP